MIEAIKKLQRQVQELTERMDSMDNWSAGVDHDLSDLFTRTEVLG